MCSIDQWLGSFSQHPVGGRAGHLRVGTEHVAVALGLVGGDIVMSFLKYDAVVSLRRRGGFQVLTLPTAAASSITGLVCSGTEP